MLWRQIEKFVFPTCPWYTVGRYRVGFICLRTLYPGFIAPSSHKIILFVLVALQMKIYPCFAQEYTGIKAYWAKPITEIIWKIIFGLKKMYYLLKLYIYLKIGVNIKFFLQLPQNACRRRGRGSELYGHVRKNNRVSFSPYLSWPKETLRNSANFLFE